MLLNRAVRQLLVRPLRLPTRPPLFSFSHVPPQDHEQPAEGEEWREGEGTEYSNWVLARSANANHDVSYLKRRYGRDRYNIHKLTNIDFMCSLVNREDKYVLNLNEKIVLLAQMNHVCNVLKKDKTIYGEFGKLIRIIIHGISDPDDYVCIGTLLNVMVDLGELSETHWVALMDALFVKKYDEEFDELFGLYAGLFKYKCAVEELGDYFELQRNKVLYSIPMVYRNSLQVVRQYVKYNLYNLKECRFLFRSLHRCGINERYFWNSVGDWFAIFIREQLMGKDIDEFFIVPEGAVDKVLYDDGMIRPRSVLEELAEVAFILSEHRIRSPRFVSFIERLIIHSIEHGSALFNRYLEIERKEAMEQRKATKEQHEEELNEHMRTSKKSEEEKIASMESKYRTIFVNPTQLSSEAIIQILIVLKRSLVQQKEEGGQKQQEAPKKEDSSRRAVDMRVLSWLAVKLCKPSMRYTVNQLLKVIECRQLLEVLKIDIKSLVLEKLKDVRDKTCSLADIKSILYFLPLLEFEKIGYILEAFLDKAHPKDILELTRLIERESISTEDVEAWEGSVAGAGGMDRSHLTAKQKNRRWMPYLTGYFLKLPAAANAHENYYSFEENCYFLYLVLKHEEYWESRVDYEYMGEIEKLKHSIKIASYSRGFKLQMDTYFYKLMSYIDVVAFFDGG